MKKLCFGSSAAVYDEHPIQPKVEHDAGWKLRFDVPADLRACREAREKASSRHQSADSHSHEINFLIKESQ
jgi:hypothetical protein